ncbi:MAG: branched-chain amino acid transaminase [Caldilineaceae bacterium]|nr:branched-chain amino acid transaminase [Caldilineaceae bacterium]
MTKYAFFNGAIVPIDQAKVSVMTHTLNYGTGCFGGLRAYWNPEQEQLYAFRFVDHFRRFLNSAKLLLAELPYTAEELAAITLDLLRTEGWREDCYVRPLLYKADEIIGVRLHNLRDALTIFSVPMGAYLPREDGLRVCTSSWRRVDDTMIPARGKLIGSYVNSALIKSDALLSGYDEALVLSQDGHVAEASAANFFMVRDGVVVTPPITDNVLEGITRRTMMHLCTHALGLPVVERSIDRTELFLADEAFLCGTGVQLAAIGSIDNRTLGDGGMGPVTRQLHTLYFDTVRGRRPEFADWLTPVYDQANSQSAATQAVAAT